ncbi:hypothetical protein [Terribacillus saccharophilus]|uniref:hypothetical protein n=1 Tax=Terribacillus saccharophilus TaxID=361277 RepID=UPI002989DA67|nr:hypothetical protein [Terribacillus saccharophilus]MCM3226118.1 hypothetical protein [Terribacillus saccharophilus]
MKKQIKLRLLPHLAKAKEFPETGLKEAYYSYTDRDRLPAAGKDLFKIGKKSYDKTWTM